MIDKEYDGDLENIKRLEKALEYELEKIEWTESKNQLTPIIAYDFIRVLKR